MSIENLFKGIAFRISISIAIVVAATTMAVGWLILREERKTLESELKSKSTYLAEIMSHHIVEPLLYEELHSLFSILDGSMKSEDSLVVYAEILERNGEVIVTAFKSKKWRDAKLPLHSFEEPLSDVNIVEDELLQVYHITVPIEAETLGTIGYLRLIITKELLFSTLKEVKQKLYFLAAAVILVGIIIGLWMARKVLMPIIMLHKGVIRIGEGEVGVEVPVVGHGEIKELAISFNRMSRKLKELIDTIKSAQEHLVRTEKLYAVGEFSAGVAHEIKNPLTSIKMLIQTAQRKRQTLTNKDFRIIEEEIDRIDKIIKEFLAFARPEKTERTNININEVINEVITITRPKMDQSAIRLEQNFSSSVPMIKGSHDALKQVFLNIVLNAIQAMDGEKGKLHIETSTNNNEISIIVNDNGVGIRKSDLKRIFDPFFTTKEEGTGMGLALTHNIINDHSGKIEIDSSPGKGTTVRIDLPL